MFKFFIGGTELSDQPIGWDSHETHFNFDTNDRTMLFTYPLSLRFWGHGCKILRDLKDTNACSNVSFEVKRNCGDGQYATLIIGKIFIPDIVWDRWDCIAETEIMDENFNALVKNNWNIKFHGFAENTKNGLPLPKLIGVSIDLFDPTNIFTVVFQSFDSSWMAFSGLRTGYDIMDYMKHQIRFMTDDLLTLRSDWYDALDVDKRTAIVIGRELRRGSFLASTDPSTIPDVSFFSLWDFLHKTENLILFIKDGEVRIESLEDTQNNATEIPLGSIKKVQESIDQEVMYSKVKIGSNTFTESGTVSINTRYLTHNTEEYHLTGDCNIDKLLDLVSNEVIFDTNTIEDVIVNDVDSHDASIFAIQYSNLAGHKANATNIYQNAASGPFQYNERYINERVMNRYRLPSDIAFYVGEDSSFQASTIPDVFFIALNNAGSGSGATPNTWEEDPLLFNDDSTVPNFDTLNNYSPVTGEYTTPFGGTHTFHVDIVIDRQGFIFGDATKSEDFEIEFQRLDSGSVLISKQLFESGIINFPEVPPSANINESYVVVPTEPIADQFNKQHQSIIVRLDYVVNLNPSDKVKVVFRVNHAYVGTDVSNYTINGVFKLLAPADNGGIFYTQFFNDYDALKFTIENKGFSLALAKQIQDAPDFALTLSDTMGSVKGWPNTMQINNATGVSNIEIRSRENLISL